jgi:hypothetical protein
LGKIVLIVSVTICSWLGWKLGEDLGMMSAYLLSFIGSLAGVVGGWWFNKNYLA